MNYSVPSLEGNATYPLRIEFFQADADGEEGQTYLGFDTFTAADYAAGGKTVLLAAPPPTAAQRILATATDSLPGGGPANTSEFSPSVVIVSPWQNPRHRLDVDDDDFIAPNDSLAVINYINAFRAGPIPISALSQPDYVDTTGDGFVSPVDALDVIDYINAFGAGEVNVEAEGESETRLAAGDARHASIVPDSLLALISADLADAAKRRKK